MERTTSIERAKRFFQKDFIGFEELNNISAKLGVSFPDNLETNIPPIPFSEEFLFNLESEYILILGIPYYKDGTPLTIVKMREHFGCDPVISEPCFYNQDWYLKEKFANAGTIELRWYLLKKDVIDNTRGVSPNTVIQGLSNKQHLPSALLTAYSFFVIYLNEPGKLLWENDYLWCSDLDHNGDRIYTGRYVDNTGINKRGFSVHRHLSLSNIYGGIHYL